MVVVGRRQTCAHTFRFSCSRSPPTVDQNRGCCLVVLPPPTWYVWYHTIASHSLVYPYYTITRKHFRRCKIAVEALCASHEAYGRGCGPSSGRCSHSHTLAPRPRPTELSGNAITPTSIIIMWYEMHYTIGIVFFERVIIIIFFFTAYIQLLMSRNPETPKPFNSTFNVEIFRSSGHI